jgi:glutamate N-acetyltransferase/amino-acid N-acetyltransferase
MAEDIVSLGEGGVTSPRGFRAGAVKARIREDWDKLDVGMVYSEAPCSAAAVFTTNKVQAAPVIVTRKHLSDGRAQAIVANSGSANAATGDRGLADAVEMAEAAALMAGVPAVDVVVASTGVIGTHLPLERLAAGIAAIELTVEGGDDFAGAIMTTDTRPRQVALRFGAYTLGGAAKGAGMIHPNMATMLCFLTTDAPVTAGFLQAALTEAVDDSFNMIDVDGDTSTNDTVVVLANGMAGGETIDEAHPMAGVFNQALSRACVHLARAIVSDAEGGTKVIEAVVQGAADRTDARRAAREVARSLAVKTAVYGSDPNWGRILAAVGNSGCAMEEPKTSFWLSAPPGPEICLYELGSPAPFDESKARSVLGGPEVRFRIDLGLGNVGATAWGSDLTEDYVRLNSLYTT